MFNLYSTFNALFNVRLSIQHSTIHFEFNYLFNNFNYLFNIQLYIQHSIYYIHSVFNYSFQFIKSF